MAIPLIAGSGERESGIDTLQSVDAAPADPGTPLPTLGEEAVAGTDPDDDVMVLAMDQYDGLAYETDDAPDSAMADWLGYFTVPVTALSGFPATEMDSFGCTDEQFRWLREHGVRYRTGSVHDEGELFELSSGFLRNTATSGGSLSIRNLRVEGEYVDQDPPRVYVVCRHGGFGDGAYPIWLLATMGDPTPAVFLDSWDETLWGGQGLPDELVGMPFTLNLAPGEYAQIFVQLRSLDRTRDFVGRVVADVVVGEDTYEFVLEEGYLQSRELIDDLFVVVGNGGLYCFDDRGMHAGATADSVYTEAELSYECTLDELVAKARASAEALG